MALRDQSVPFSRRKIFVADNTKEKESTARPRACWQTKDSCPLKGAAFLGRCVSPRGDTAKRLLSPPPPRESRRGTSKNAERELVAHGDKQFGTRW